MDGMSNVCRTPNRLTEIRTTGAIAFSNKGASNLTESTPFSGATEGTVADNRLVGVSIVAVDDNADARLLLEIILKQSGAKIITCESALQALETIRSVHPDVVLSDILMPDMDGYEFLNELRALGAWGGGRVPVIALTAFASESDIVRIVKRVFKCMFQNQSTRQNSF
jgi:CheY-like chemotaxis protein